MTWCRSNAKGRLRADRGLCHYRERLKNRGAGVDRYACASSAAAPWQRPIKSRWAETRRRLVKAMDARRARSTLGAADDANCRAQDAEVAESDEFGRKNAIAWNTNSSQFFDLCAIRADAAADGSPRPDAWSAGNGQDRRCSRRRAVEKCSKADKAGYQSEARPCLGGAAPLYMNAKVQSPGE